MKRPLRFWRALRKALRSQSVSDAFKRGYALGAEHATDRVERESRYAKEDRESFATFYADVLANAHSQHEHNQSVLKTIGLTSKRVH